MELLQGFVAAHGVAIGSVVALWVAVASYVNRTVWPKPIVPPAALWQKDLHFLLIDLPGFLPSRGMKGIFGLPFNIPFLTVSRPDPTAPALPPLKPAA